MTRLFGATLYLSILLLKPQGCRWWLAGWPVTVGVVEVGVVSQPGADAERYRCACLHCTQGLAGRGDGYQCGLDWGRFSAD